LIIKQFVSIDRPETVLEWVWKLLLKHIPDASFPSDHSAVSTAFLLSLFYTNYKKIWYLFLIFTILMCTSRIILWVHWPFDILAGILVWVLSAIISFKVLKWNKYVDIFNKFILKLANYLKL
jgi:undecaprenyl-diphosphatase